MRHGDKVNNLGRKTAHRKAMLSNMTCSLIEHKRIITTLAKAKALRVYAEPIITRSKEDSMHNRRMVFSHLQSKEAIKELFGVIGDKVANRPGGYTRIIKLPRRIGDAADVAMIELVDFNEIYNVDDKSGPSKKTRRGRSKAGSAPATGAATANTAAAAAATTETAPATDDKTANNATAEAANTDIAAEQEAPTPPASPAAEEEQNQPTGENTAEGNA